MAPKENEEPKFPLHTAAAAGNLFQVESLLNSDPKPAAAILKRDDDGRLPQHWATVNGHAEILDALLRRAKDPEEVVDELDGSGWSCLMIAASIGDEKLVESLAKRGADVNLKNSGGQTSLHIVTAKEHVDVARLLVSEPYNASTRIRDKRQQLPLHRAAAVGSVQLIKLLLDNKSPLDATDIDGQTALHHAIAEGNGDAAAELLRRGAAADKKDSEGKLAIELAPDQKMAKFIKTFCENEGIELPAPEK